jgi:hypothetical protein
MARKFAELAEQAVELLTRNPSPRPAPQAPTQLELFPDLPAPQSCKWRRKL